MPGSPKKRAKQVLEAEKRMEVVAKAQAEERALAIPPKRVKFTQGLGEYIASLIASGVPIVDSTLKGAVIAPGVATRIGVNPGTLYEWQHRFPAFAESIARAREESAHRVADRMLSLADVALAEPAMANAVRIAADILRWQAGVRQPNTYGERQRVDIHRGEDLAEVLRRARERVLEAPAVVGVLPAVPALPDGFVIESDDENGA